ncbi:MAG: ABC transporter ATP-binding protein [Flavobacteriaceae bacterium]
MNSFKRILIYALPYKGYAFLNIGFNILYALFSALAFVSFIPMLKVLFGETETAPTKPIYKGVGDLKTYLQDWMNYEVSTRSADAPEQTLVAVILLVLALFFLKNLFNYLALFFITFFRNGLLKDLRNTLYQKILSLPIAYFTEQRKGDLMARMSADVYEIQTSFLSILVLLIREPLTIIFTLMLMFSFSVQLTLFVLIFIPIAGFIISLIGKNLKKQSSLVQQEQADMLSLIDETVNGQKVIKNFNAGTLFHQRFKATTQSFFHLSNHLINRQNLGSPISEFLGIGVIGVLLWFGGRMVLLEGALSGTSFIVYMGLAYNILTPAKGISKATYSIRKGNAAAERLLEILDTPDQIEDAKDAVVLEKFNQQVSFENIRFSFEDKPVIQDLSLDIPKGAMVALVGQSGSGKTTLANLLNRFYDVDAGDITIDGVSITRLKKKSLYAHIGMVTQESILFNASVADNLRVGKADASLAEMTEAAQIANAMEFIEKLPQGFDTPIGEGGSKLSGGQKQRLSIARAVLKNPDILILDEATSALDTASEKLVQEALEKLMQERTSLVIAHRLSTVQKADKIVVLHEGKIVEQGTHQELIALNQRYTQLVQLQQL